MIMLLLLLLLLRTTTTTTTAATTTTTATVMSSSIPSKPWSGVCQRRGVQRMHAANSFGLDAGK